MSESTSSIVGIGVDAVDIERFSQMAQRTPSTLERIFTSRELEYANLRVDPIPNLAVRFAAREATMKALGVGLGAFDLQDVSIVNEVSGQPKLLVGGRALELAQRSGVTHWKVSLTHTASVAIAYVMAVAELAVPAVACAGESPHGVSATNSQENSSESRRGSSSVR